MKQEVFEQTYFNKTDQLKQIYAEMEKQAKQGATKLEWYAPLTEYTIEQLKKEGFLVEPVVCGELKSTHSIGFIVHFAEITEEKRVQVNEAKRKQEEEPFCEAATLFRNLLLIQGICFGILIYLLT
ncbi:hypothetical protein [Enterococcus sp. 5H]|uniref:hypothetical protein n=1 Tax=Enterococcus sp. 5H TaxID=1229490 RepID=UPI0023025E9C|nr:hypothetical protein [Enterococcus sp. 5H]MDA9469901.1 hypothetical protein [Enterococcus sp. 5H]